MGTSKAQREGIKTICQCGCNEEFIAFPVYRKKSDGGGLRVPEYKRGHHPNCRKTQTGQNEPWNKGLTINDHPSIKRMGFQPGHTPYNNWSHVNALLQNNPSLREKWLTAKRNQTPWNKGKHRSEYPNGITNGPEHGNWKGGYDRYRCMPGWDELRNAVMKRDNWTCQICGDHNHKGRGSRIVLHVHHIIAVCQDFSLALDPDNLITLCESCHHATHNYGSKAVKKSGN